MMETHDDEESAVFVEMSETVKLQGEDKNTARPTKESVEDLTTEIVDVSSDDAASDEIVNVDLGNGEVAFKPRAYQIEMLEESLKRNIVVAVSAF
jgi:hypothetical protein